MRAGTSDRRALLMAGFAAAAVLVCGFVAVSGPTAAAAPPVRPAAAAAAAEGSARVVPPEIQVPAGNRLVARLHASGVQVYQCAAGAWAFVEPAAQLSDRGRRPAAIHFRGPSWESIRDGSLVEAKAVASAPVAGSIPQLLLQATRTRGDGIFGDVTYIQRLATTGGAAPTTTCADGQTDAVPYTAEYRFYAPS